MTTDTGKPLRKRRKLTKIASEPVLRTPRLTFTAVASNHRGTYNVLSEQTFLPNPTAPLRPAGLSPPDRYDTQPSDTVFPTFSPSDIPKNKRVPKNAKDRDPMVDWTRFSDLFLDEMIRLEGCGGVNSNDCGMCSSHCPENSIYRCIDCFGGGLICASCMIGSHQQHPFHCIKRWTGKFFEPSSLNALGSVLTLGHGGGTCPLVDYSSPNSILFTVLHVNGPHTVNIVYCRCSSIAYVSYAHQLLRARLFPATTSDPRTCATLEMLRHVHLLMLEAKVSTQHVNTWLSRLVNNAGVYPTPDRYRSLLLMIRQYRYLKMMKRAGRGHSPEGVGGTSRAELAVICPVCPHPDVNLPPNWGNNPSKAFLYKPVITVDANFKLRNCIRPSETVSALNSYAYFVRDDEYREYVAASNDTIVPSNCNKLAAHDHANVARSGSLRTTGVAGAACGRHGLFLPLAIANLGRGEQYASIDYMLFSGTQAIKVPIVIISYDINCQWSVNVLKRTPELPPYLQPKFIMEYVIPKLHLQGHTLFCRARYSLNYRPGVGRTCGEGIERNWAQSNHAANSTKEMTSGHRQDTLEDVFGDMNYRKIVALPGLMAKNLKKARLSATLHEFHFAAMTDHLQPHTKEWEVEFAMWEKDPINNPDIFALTTQHKTLAELRRELVEAERLDENDRYSKEKQSGSGSFVDPVSNIPSATAFLSLALNIEQKQRHLLSSIAMLNKNNQTPTMGAKLAADRLSLTKLISNFYRERLRLLEPCELDSIYTDRPESAPLYLPSDAPFGSPRSLKAVALGETEAAMRFAHAFDAIEAIRIGLGVRASLWRYKVDQVTGYGATSRTGTLVSDAQGRIASSATCYRDNRAAYLRLKGSGEWDNMLRPLNHEDLRPMAEPDDKALLDTGVIGKGKGKGRVDPKEGHRTVSWIWYSYGDDDSPEGSMQKGLRVQWGQARARVKRWQEEIQLLEEEQRRFVVYLGWAQKVWDGRHKKRTGVSPELEEGLSAYAARQADIIRLQVLSAQQMWRNGGVEHLAKPLRPAITENTDVVVKQTDDNVASGEADEPGGQAHEYKDGEDEDDEGDFDDDSDYGDEFGPAVASRNQDTTQWDDDEYGSD